MTNTTRRTWFGLVAAVVGCCVTGVTQAKPKTWGDFARNHSIGTVDSKGNIRYHNCTKSEAGPNWTPMQNAKLKKHYPPPQWFEDDDKPW